MSHKLLFVALICLLAATASADPASVNGPTTGGDRDAHGCIGSAGYAWCEAKAKCLRPWEEKCEVPSAVSVPLAAFRERIRALDENADAGIITKAQAEQGKARYMKEASAAAGHQVTEAELQALPDTAAAAQTPAELTALQRFAGLITFVNVLWVLAIVVGVICFAFLFGRFVVTVLVNVPLVFYEFLFYVGSVSLMFWGRTMSPGVAPYVGLAGALLFGAAVLFTAKAHKGLNLGGALISAIVCFVWANAALAYGSSMLGFIAVAALMSAFGFSVLVSPLCYCIGFKDEGAVGRATAAAFAVLIAYVCVRTFGLNADILRVFEAGGLFLGSFVGYLGLLIASSRWYDGKNRGYVLFQVVTVAAGIAALLVGSVFGIGELQKIGGTFFVLYCVEKLFEIPVKSKTGYACIGLAASMAIFGFCLYIKSDPESLRPYIFMPR